MCLAETYFAELRLSYVFCGTVYCGNVFCGNVFAEPCLAEKKADGLVIRDRIITNFVPDGYKPLKSITNPKHYELFNVPESVENSLLFLNGYHFYYIADGSNYVSRTREGLSQKIIDEIFDRIDFHKISPLLTPNGIWRLYVANRKDYMLLLSRPYLFGNYMFDEAPNCLKLHQAIPELSNVHIEKCNYEGGSLFIFNIYDRSKFINIVHLNGSSLKMLKLFYTRNLNGMSLHSSIIDNSILVFNQPSKEKVLDILKSIRSAKPPNYSQRGNSSRYILLTRRNIIHFPAIILKSVVVPSMSNESSCFRIKDGFVIRGRMKMNFVPDGYKPFRSMNNPKHYELFNVPESDENRLLFLNGYPSNYYVYRRINQYIKSLFQFHKIFAPLTTKGVWRLYMAIRDEYLQLLRQPYMFGKYILDESAIATVNYYFNSEQKISPSQIYLYSRSDKLATTEQVLEAIPEISDIHIAKCDYEGGNLFVFHIYDRSKFLHVKPEFITDGTKDYIMTFGDDITYLLVSHSINNISSNILVAFKYVYPRDLSDKNIPKPQKYTSKRYEIICRKNFKEFKSMIGDIMFTHNSFSK
ncbi:hypothetical protein RF11_10691 [Thelohanellus kitauei]|uniref:Uncharacterized protein n=1 Tax=Thelohanellus kitauei TaxID=669202 RepID=A0A0C2MYW0_THEKT|nr:hypothetical protein RF11_10691 [Thelohanellus kitauei]